MLQEVQYGDAVMHHSFKPDNLSQVSMHQYKFILYFSIRTIKLTGNHCGYPIIQDNIKQMNVPWKLPVYVYIMILPFLIFYRKCWFTILQSAYRPSLHWSTVSLMTLTKQHYQLQKMFKMHTHYMHPITQSMCYHSNCFIMLHFVFYFTVI